MNIFVPTREERERLREQRILLARARVGDADAMALLRMMGLVGYWHNGRTICGTERFNPNERLRQG